ncbi:MAG: hypothetical protein JW862_04960 [Anaerolineales bacterium]|nr:hypothetical protein [Anaerolineales bacterium]
MTPARECRKLTLRIYDPALIAWLDALPSDYGHKSQAIVDVMQRGLGMVEQTDSGKASVDFEAALPVIRQVVEAAVASALAHIQLVGVHPATPIEEPDQVEAMLQRFDDSLLLDEDDA